MGLDSLSSRRDRAKLKLWHNLCTMKRDRYPRQLFDQVWEVKPLLLHKEELVLREEIVCVSHF